MGSYISRWRRKPSTVEVLEKLDKDIVRLERLKQSDTEQQKRIVASLILYSVLFYIVAALAFYFYFMPKLWFDRVWYSLPLLLFPGLVWLLKSFLHWYFVKRIHKNDEALEKLKQKKKEILEEVMEKETYKKAKEILEKFAPDVQPPPPKSPAAVEPRPGEQLRQRPMPSSAVFHPPQTPSPAATSTTAPPSSAPGHVFHSTPVLNVQRQIGGAPVYHAGGSPMRFGAMPPGPPMPRPVLPRDRTLLDRMMEYLIGDGPQNRYALICSQCSSHNGMALREEFEFISFRCCYCYHVNPARRQKPRAPSLDEQRPTSTQPDTAVLTTTVTDVVAAAAAVADSEEDIVDVDEPVATVENTERELVASAADMEVDDFEPIDEVPADVTEQTTDGQTTDVSTSAAAAAAAASANESKKTI